MFFLLYRHIDDGVSDDFLKISEDFRGFSKIIPMARRTFPNILRKFPIIFEDFREFPKISQDCRRLSRKTRRYLISVKTSISSLVRIWKLCHSGPGCGFVWILRMVYFPVKPQASQTHDSRFDLCTRTEWDVTALSTRCYVTHWAVENLSALQGIVWNLKQRGIKSRNGIKCYVFE